MPGFLDPHAPSVAAEYAVSGEVISDHGDGYVRTGQRTTTFEIKCARINIANRSQGAAEENWAFANLLASPGGAPKQYDVLIAVGILVLGLEDSRYWDRLETIRARLSAEGRNVNLSALPHEATFLSICSFFILPRSKVPTILQATCHTGRPQLICGMPGVGR